MMRHESNCVLGTYGRKARACYHTQSSGGAGTSELIFTKGNGTVRAPTLLARVSTCCIEPTLTLCVQVTRDSTGQVVVFDNVASGGLKKLGPLGKQVRNTTYHRIIRVGTARFSTFVCAYYRTSRTCDAIVKTLLN